MSRLDDGPDVQRLRVLRGGDAAAARGTAVVGRNRRVTPAGVTMVTAADPPLGALLGGLSARCIEAQLARELRIELQVHDGPEREDGGTVKYLLQQ